MTMDTEIPPIIPKDQRKKQPEKNDFEKKMNELDNQINNLRTKIVTPPSQ